MLTKPRQAHLAKVRTFIKTFNSSHPYKVRIKNLMQALLISPFPLEILDTFRSLDLSLLNFRQNYCELGEKEVEEENKKKASLVHIPQEKPISVPNRHENTAS